MIQRDVHAAWVGLGAALVLGGVVLAANAGAAHAGQDPRAWGPDPFGAPPVPADRPVGTAQPTPSARVELQGIIAGPRGMVAIIDSTIVRIGDRVGAERVIDITPRAVVLQTGDYTRRLVMSVLGPRGR
ncbi:MAG: hypothetical protein ACOYXR_02415 [Nitrospirota bacterium]